MVKNLGPGVVLIVAMLSAMINDVMDGAKISSLVLWTVAVLALLVILARGYAIGTEIDNLGGVTHKFKIGAHMLLHVVPLTYFSIAYGTEVPGRTLEAIYLIPILFFFVTGVRTWKLCHELFGTRLYKMFQIGNRQMLILFPCAFAVDMIGWPIQGAAFFSRLMHVYFIIHIMLTGITIPLMGRDLRRYAADSLRHGEPPAVP